MSAAPVRDYVYDATCSRIVDGDTVVLDVDLGGNVHVYWTCRLRGMDTPSKRSEPGKASIAYLTSLLYEPDGDRRALVVSTEKDEDDVYGRYLARLWVPSIDVEVVPAMVEAKHGVWWDGRGGHPDQPGAETSTRSTKR